MASDLIIVWSHYWNIFIADHSIPRMCRYSKLHNFWSLENLQMGGMVHGKIECVSCHAIKNKIKNYVTDKVKKL